MCCQQDRECNDGDGQEQGERHECTDHNDDQSCDNRPSERLQVFRPSHLDSTLDDPSQKEKIPPRASLILTNRRGVDSRRVVPRLSSRWTRCASGCWPTR